jgi:hypothetical protein
MVTVLTSKPDLDEHDFKTIRDIYGQAQNWARHYDSLVVSVNVVLVSASMIFVGVALRGEGIFGRSPLVLMVPVMMSIIGLVLTRMLFNLYAACIVRLIRIENLLNCFDPEKFNGIDGAGSLIPSWLMKQPPAWPPTVRFFVTLHGLLMLVYAAVLIVGSVSS